MTDSQRLRVFEQEKQRLQEKKLPPAEYQREIQKLARKLKV